MKNFQAVDARTKRNFKSHRVNHNTTWGTVLVENGKPRLVIDGVFYDIPFTKDIASQVKYIVNTELNKKVIDPYVKPNLMALTNYNNFDITILYWSYVYTGQKVRCNVTDNGCTVNISLLNNAMEKKYKALCEKHKDYDKLTYTSNAHIIYKDNVILSK